MSDTIQVMITETFQVAVPANPSEGIVTCLEKLPDFLCLVNATFVPAVPGLPSKGGTQIFTFIAVEGGEGDIDMVDIATKPSFEKLPQGPLHKRHVIVDI